MIRELELIKGIPIITLHQPYAFYIMMGWKTIETRLHDRFKNLVGKTIGIHSSMKKFDINEVDSNPYLEDGQKYLAKRYFNKFYKFTYGLHLQRGYILGTVFVHGLFWAEQQAERMERLHDEFNASFIREGFSKQALIDCETVNRFCLELVDINKFNNPIKAKGSQGIWYYKEAA